MSVRRVYGCPGVSDDLLNNYKPLPADVGEQLHDFHVEVLNGSNDVWIGYTDSGFIVVNILNKDVWSKNIHDEFCEKFDLILHYYEGHSPRGLLVEVFLVYIPRPVTMDSMGLLSVDYPEELLLG